jgi:cell division septation protein DedD
LLSGVLLLAILYPFVRPAHAEIAVGTSSAGFLNFEVGARSSGMAGAGIGLGAGVTSQYWNPAFLADLNRPEVGGMHAAWLNGLSYEWFGYARPMSPKWGVGSLSVAYFHMPSFAGYDEFDQPIGEFKAYDMALTAGLARAITPAISVGGNARFIRQNLADVSGTGAAVDLGVKGLVAGTTLGASVQNLGPDLSLGGASYPIPRQVRFGASRAFHRDQVTLAADYNIPRDYYRDIRVGTEVRPHPVVAVRMGYRHELGSPGDPQTGLSFGLGLRWKQLAVDYAMTPDNAFDNVQRLSFGYSFGGGEEKTPEPKRQPRHEKPEPPAPPAGPKVIARTNPVKPPGSAPPAAPAPAVASKPAASAPAAPQPAPAVTEPTKAVAQVPPAPKAASKGVLYDVVLGSFQSEEGARSELKALEILGFQVKDAKIAPLPGGGYRLSLARFGSKKSADGLASSLTRMSFQPRVEMVQR